MIGRASIGYPWIFREVKHYLKTGELLPGPTMSERLEAVRMHLERSILWKGPKVGIVEMRRHYTNYFRGLPHVKEFRNRLVTEFDHIQILSILDEMENVYAGHDLITDQNMCAV